MQERYFFRNLMYFFWRKWILFVCYAANTLRSQCLDTYEGGKDHTDTIRWTLFYTYVYQFSTQQKASLFLMKSIIVLYSRTQIKGNARLTAWRGVPQILNFSPHEPYFIQRCTSSKQFSCQKKHEWISVKVESSNFPNKSFLRKSIPVSKKYRKLNHSFTFLYALNFPHAKQDAS